MPVCRDDLVCLPKKLMRKAGGGSPLMLCSRITSHLHLLNPLTLKHLEIRASDFYNSPFRAICNSRQLVEFVVLDLRPLVFLFFFSRAVLSLSLSLSLSLPSPFFVFPVLSAFFPLSSLSHLPFLYFFLTWLKKIKHGQRRGKWSMAEVECARSADLGVNDIIFECTTRKIILKYTHTQKKKKNEKRIGC